MCGHGKAGGLVAVVVGCVLSVLVAQVGDDPVWFVNWSASSPAGVYRASAKAPDRGAYVVVNEEAVWWPETLVERMIPLLKVVVAVGGDEVSVSEAGVAVNGALIERSGWWRRFEGAPAEGFNRTLRAEEVFVVSSVDRAFDSRYFGPVSRSAVRRVDLVQGFR